MHRLTTMPLMYMISCYTCVHTHACMNAGSRWLTGTFNTASFVTPFKLMYYNCWKQRATLSPSSGIYIHHLLSHYYMYVQDDKTVF